jgi:hypothetical protein
LHSFRNSGRHDQVDQRYSTVVREEHVSGVRIGVVEPSYEDLRM